MKKFQNSSHLNVLRRLTEIYNILIKGNPINLKKLHSKLFKNIPEIRTEIE